MKGTQSFKVQLIEMVREASAANAGLSAENKLLAFKLENSAHYLKLIREESMGLMYELGRLRADIQRGALVPGGEYTFRCRPGVANPLSNCAAEGRRRADDTLIVPEGI